MPDRFGVTTEEKVEKLKGHLKMMADKYPRLIEQGLLSQKRADRRATVFMAILADYDKLQCTYCGAVWPETHDMRINHG